MKTCRIATGKFLIASATLFALSVLRLPEAWCAPNASNGSSVAGVSRNPNNMEAFWLDGTRAINHTFWNGGSWGSNIEAYPGSYGPYLNMTVVSRESDHWELFYPTQAGGLDHIYWYSSSGDSGPVAVKASINNVAPAGGISAVSRAQNAMDVFYVSQNRYLQRVYWTDTSGWSDPQTLAIAVYPNSSVAAISLNPNNMDVFYIGSNRSLRHVYWNGNSWSTPEQLTSTFSVFATSNAPVPGIAVVSRASNMLETFFVGSDQYIHHVYWTLGQPWSSDSRLDGNNFVALSDSYTGGSLAAVSTASNQMDVFWLAPATRAYDGRAVASPFHNYFNGSAWSGPQGVGRFDVFDINNNVYAGFLGVAAVTRYSIDEELWFVDADNYLLQDRNYPSSWGGWNKQTLPRYMPIARITQQSLNWCWAAVCQMVANFKGNGVQQCDLANWKTSRSDCCVVCRPECDTTGSVPDTFDHLNIGNNAISQLDCDSSGTNCTSTGIPAIGFWELSNQIANNSPEVTDYHWTGGGGHSEVVVGTYVWDDGSQWVSVWDPAPGGGEYDKLYGDWVSGPGYAHMDDVWFL